MNNQNPARQLSNSNVITKKKGFIDVFLEGARSGVNIWFNNLLPGIVFGYVLIEVLKALGILPFLGSVFSPVMAVFGLPGEAMGVLVTALASLSAGCAAAAALVADGTLNGAQATIMLPMILLIGSQLQFLGRILAVAEVPPKKYWINCLIGIICATIAGLIMKFLTL